MQNTARKSGIRASTTATQQPRVDRPVIIRITPSSKYPKSVYEPLLSLPIVVLKRHLCDHAGEATEVAYGSIGREVVHAAEAAA